MTKEDVAGLVLIGGFALSVVFWDIWILVGVSIFYCIYSLWESREINHDE